jgi:hypothetical protein
MPEFTGCVRQWTYPKCCSRVLRAGDRPLTACTTRRLLPALVPACVGCGRTIFPPIKEDLLLGAQGTGNLPDCWWAAASMATKNT